MTKKFNLNSKTSIAIALAVVLAIAGYFAYTLKRENDLKISNDALEKSGARIDALLNRTSITLPDYIEISEGWSYDRVKVLLKVDGIEQASNEIGGVKTIIYKWQNSDGGNILLTFQDGKLVSKAQAGLK